MNEEEVFFRDQLRRIRGIATIISFAYQCEQIMFSRWPESQAWAMVEGMSYRVAACMVIDAELLSGEFKIEDYKYHPAIGLSATREEVVEYLYEAQEKHLKNKLDPIEVWSQVIMPLVKFELEKYERIMVNQGYRLPKWERPEWLREMESRET